jgi:hypothetical protein
MQAVQAIVRTSPWSPVAACELAAVALFGGSLAGGLHGSLLLVTPLSVALLGLVLAIKRWDEHRELRASADAWIERGYDNPRSKYGWRVEELTSAHERKTLAATLRSIVDELGRSRSTSVIPLDRIALRPCRPALAAIAARLEDCSSRVSARGVLAVQRLIADGRTSPLYNPSAAAGSRLNEILDCLEVRS